MQLTEYVRARDVADQRDQGRFRHGDHEDAIGGYHARGRVVISDEQRPAEDTALEAAHADRDAGTRTLVIAQTSNEHLDQLNARAQAIRHQHHQLGADGFRVPGRPYRLHVGDEVQVRRTIDHPQVGQIRNGQSAQVVHVDDRHDTLTLKLDHERPVRLGREQVNRADLRLAYVQHPFPAQGQTTDTAHVIVAEHATQEGTYVSLTRARERTHVYASLQQLHDPDEPLVALAQHVGRSQPDVPSIHSPLAHERELTDQQARELIDQEPTLVQDRDHHQPEPAHPTTPQRDEVQRDDEPEQRRIVTLLGPRPRANDPNLAAWQKGAMAIHNYRTDYDISDDEPSILGPEPATGEFTQRLDRHQAAIAARDALDQLGRLTPARRLEPNARTRETDQTIADRTDGWEP